jgi:sporulation protein YlmC with PRC-barrel domain
MSEVQSQLLTHIFLTVVNLFGVWRWLGREAQYEKGGANAARRSRAAAVPTLFSSAGLAGSKVTGSDGARLGTVIDAMLRTDRAEIAYVVIGDGAFGGLGETLRAVEPARLEFQRGGVTARLGLDEFRALPPLEDGTWPVSAQAAQVG